jgi:hypothetical protein
MRSDTSNIPVASIAQSHPSSSGGSTPQVVFGIPLLDPDFAKLTRAVLFSAFAMAILAIICSILQFVIGTDYVTAVAGSIFIPLFGWFGVKSRKRDCLQAFYVCNIVCALLFVYMAIVILSVSLPNAKCLCVEPNCSLLAQYKATNTTSNQNTLKEIAQYCTNYPRIVTANYVSLGLGALMCLLQVWGAYAGKKLRDHQHFNFEISPDESGAPLPLPMQTYGMPPQMMVNGGGGGGGGRPPFNPYTQGASMYNTYPQPGYGQQQQAYYYPQQVQVNAYPQYGSQYAGPQQGGQRVIHPATATLGQPATSSSSSSSSATNQTFIPPGGRQAPPLAPWLDPVDCAITTTTTSPPSSSSSSSAAASSSTTSPRR